jgi:hypothetical protein
MPMLASLLRSPWGQQGLALGSTLPHSVWAAHVLFLCFPVHLNDPARHAHGCYY